MRIISLRTSDLCPHHKTTQPLTETRCKLGEIGLWTERLSRQLICSSSPRSNRTVRHFVWLSIDMPGPKRANPSYDYFQYDEKIKSKCIIGDCNEQVAGRGGNLKRRLQRKHKDVFVSVQEKKQENNKALDERDDGKKKPVKVEIDSNIILNSCIEIVTVNGRPFSYFDDSGFHNAKILAPILVALPEEIAISAESVRYQI